MLIVWFSLSILDIDECLQGNHSCHSVATCTNTVGAFTCECNAGYGGDGFTCNGMSCAFTFLDIVHKLQYK